MKTFTTYDKSTGIYTMALIDKGGPIICGKDLVEVKKKFDEAIGFMNAIVKLKKFKTNGSF